MQQTDNQNLSFPEDSSEIISDILGKYGLEETDDEVDEKLFGKNDSPLRGEVVARIAARAARKEVSDKEISAILQKELNIPGATAEKIAGDIKTKLIALATIKSPSLEISEEGNKLVEKIKPPIEMPGMNKTITTEKSERKEIPETLVEDDSPIIRKKMLSKTKNINMEREEPKKQSDNYREPIE